MSLSLSPSLYRFLSLTPCDLRQLRPSTTLYNALWHNKLELRTTLKMFIGPDRPRPTPPLPFCSCDTLPPPPLSASDPYTHCCGCATSCNEAFWILIYFDSLNTMEEPFINGSLRRQPLAPTCRSPYLLYSCTYSKVSFFVVPPSSYGNL